MGPNIEAAKSYLEITSAEKTDSGVYKIVATNSHGNIEKCVEVTVAESKHPSRDLETLSLKPISAKSHDDMLKQSSTQVESVSVEKVDKNEEADALHAAKSTEKVEGNITLQEEKNRKNEKNNEEEKNENASVLQGLSGKLSRERPLDTSEPLASENKFLGDQKKKEIGLLNQQTNFTPNGFTPADLNKSDNKQKEKNEIEHFGAKKEDESKKKTIENNLIKRENQAEVVSELAGKAEDSIGSQASSKKTEETATILSEPTTKKTFQSVKDEAVQEQEPLNEFSTPKVNVLQTDIDTNSKEELKNTGEQRMFEKGKYKKEEEKEEKEKEKEKEEKEKEKEEKKEKKEKEKEENEEEEKEKTNINDLLDDEKSRIQNKAQSFGKKNISEETRSRLDGSFSEVSFDMEKREAVLTDILTNETSLTCEKSLNNVEKSDASLQRKMLGGGGEKIILEHTPSGLFGDLEW